VTTMTLSALPIVPASPGAPEGAPTPPGTAIPGAGSLLVPATDPGSAGRLGAFQAALAVALGPPTPGVPVPGIPISDLPAPGVTVPGVADSGTVPGGTVPGVPPGVQDLPGAATTLVNGGPPGLTAPGGPNGQKRRWGPQAAVAQLPSEAGAAVALLAGTLPVIPLTGSGATPAAVDPASALATVASSKEGTPAPGPQASTPGPAPEAPSAQPPEPGGPPAAPAAQPAAAPPVAVVAPSVPPPVPPKGLPQAAKPGAPPDATGGAGELPAASATAAAMPTRGTGGPASAKPVLQGDDPGTPPTGSVPLHAPGGTTSNAAPGAATAAGPSALARRVMDAVTQVRDAPPPAHVVVDVPELDGLRMRVSLSGSTVHVAFIGESPDAAQDRVGSLIQDVASGLSGTGLQLGDVTTGGRPGSGNPERQQAVWGQPSAPARARSRAAGLRI